MTHLLDTNICIDVIRRRSAGLIERIRNHEVDSLGISTITLSELNYGVAKSSNPDRNRLALLEFLVPFRIVAFDDRSAQEYGDLRQSLEASGTPIGPMDMLIAAHALSLGVPLVTNNEKEFRRVSGLVVENWIV